MSIPTRPITTRPALRSILACSAIVAVGLTGASLTMSSCDSRAGSKGITAATPPDQTYTVRGRVIELPDVATSQSLQIQHEKIPTFVGKSGEVTGMKEMIMEFAWIAPSAQPADLAVGDAIEMTFEVRWKAEPRTLVTKLVRLAPDTSLDLQAVSDPS